MGNGAKDMKNKLASGGRGIELLFQRDQVDFLLFKRFDGLQHLP